jgi:hypothetical protein
VTTLSATPSDRPVTAPVSRTKTRLPRSAIAGRPTDAPDPSADWTRSPNCSPCRPNTPLGVTPYPITCDNATAEALQAVVDLDLDVLADIKPPRGYGRD